MFNFVASQMNQLQQANKLDKDVAKCQHCKSAVISRVYMETLGPNCTPARQMHFCTSITKSTCCIWDHLFKYSGEMWKAECKYQNQEANHSIQPMDLLLAKQEKTTNQRRGKKFQSTTEQ
jgi:hypothetical protein